MKWISVDDRLPKLKNNWKTKFINGEVIGTYSFSDMVLAYDPHHPDVYVVCSVDNFGVWDDDTYGYKTNPTHWMPLPDPPNTQAK